MSGVLESQPEPELRVLPRGAGEEPERRVSSAPSCGTAAIVASVNAAPQDAQKRAPPALVAPQDGQCMEATFDNCAMQVDYEKARRHLIRHDPVLGALVKQLGPCGFDKTRKIDRFAMTVRSIVSQQLSMKA